MQKANTQDTGGTKLGEGWESFEKVGGGSGALKKIKLLEQFFVRICPYGCESPEGGDPLELCCLFPWLRAMLERKYTAWDKESSHCASMWVLQKQMLNRSTQTTNYIYLSNCMLPIQSYVKTPSQKNMSSMKLFHLSYCTQNHAETPATEI